jgi:N-acetylmuramic acid 6-phosphate etherase
MKNIDLKKISTENQNRRTKSIDRVSTLKMVKMLNREDKQVPKAISKVT